MPRTGQAWAESSMLPMQPSERRWIVVCKPQSEHRYEQVQCKTALRALDAGFGIAAARRHYAPISMKGFWTSYSERAPQLNGRAALGQHSTFVVLARTLKRVEGHDLRRDLQSP